MFNDDFIFTVTNAVLYAKNMELVRRYWRTIGRLPNIANPQRYSERMLWRKIIDHNPQFVLFSDKLATKDFLKDRCPDLPVPRTLWIGRDANAIPDELLRGDVFVKANHGCGFNYRIRGGQYDRGNLQKTTKRWLGSVYGRKSGQWAYSKVEPKLFVEESVGDAEARREPDRPAAERPCGDGALPPGCAVRPNTERWSGLCTVRFFVEWCRTVWRRDHGVSGGWSFRSRQPLGQCCNHDRLGFNAIALSEITAQRVDANLCRRIQPPIKAEWWNGARCRV